MTALNVSLSAALQSELSNPGIWAYAVYFDSTGSAVWNDLVTNGVVQDSGTVAINLPSPYVGGKVYFLVQSQASSDPNDLATLITQESDINWTNAAAYDFRYDSFEVTLQNSATDKGNLTSVNGFGLPMEVSIPYSDGTTGTVGYGISGSTVVSDIQHINTSNTYTYNYTSGPLAGYFRTAVSPSEAVAGGVANPPFQASDWSAYVQSLEGPQAENVVLSGLFNGAPDANNVWHNGGYFAYQLQWDSTDQVFWLVPLASSQIKGDIQLTAANLENSIYSTLGAANIYTNMTDAQPFLASMNTGANNQWGKVLSQFLTGFTGGYYGSSGQSLNPQVTAPINLDQGINWDPTYAFNQHLVNSPPAYMNSDPYSQIFYANTNSYGSGYSDALTSQYAVGGPLIAVSEPGTSTNVPNINLTIYADGETPAGYTAPKIYNYIAAPSNVYATPDTGTSGNNIVLSFASGVAHNAGVVPDSTDTITLSILTSDAGSVPTWSTVTLDGQAVGGAGLWQNWDITYDSSTGSYQAAPSSPAVGQPAGTVLIGGFPTAESGVSWYQIGVGGKTFNLYVTSSGGQFENPNYAGQQGALAIDGLATITAPQSAAQMLSTFSVNFTDNDTTTIDPSLLVANTAGVSGLTRPDAPVAGTLSGNLFTALPGQSSAISNAITTTVSDVAFAWTGENDDPNTASWISAYTNKIDGQDVALVTITPASGPAITATGTADIDGVWQTGVVDLGVGTYTVTMAEYLPTDTQFTTPLTTTSNPLTLTVTSGLPCFVAGTLIRAVGGEVPVEQLAVGTVVPTGGGRGDATIIWIGYRTLDCRRHPRPESVMPIRICRDAFGAGRPGRDILLSPDHAVFVEDVLIPVRYLVNDTTVRREPWDVVTYYHVELDRHDILLAAGLPVESFLDTGNRSAFANGGPTVQVHPNFGPGMWEAYGCAPLTVNGPEVERARALLRVMESMNTARAIAA